MSHLRKYLLRVGLFGNFLCYLMLGAACRDNYRIIQDNLDLEEQRDAYGALIVLYNFQRQTVDKLGRTDWNLKARKAAVFQDGLAQKFKRLLAYDLHFIQYRANATNIDFELQSQKGDLNAQQQQLDLSGETLFKDSQKRIMRSNRMRYDLKEKLLTTTAPVWLQTPSVKSLCRKGIHLKLGSDSQICRAPRIYGSRILADDPVQDVLQ